MATVEAECALLREWLSMAGVDKDAIRTLVAGQVGLQVHQHFDVKRLDEELTEQPRWLLAMVEDARWRPLLYDLCIAHPHCALISAAVRQIAQGAHAAEVQAHTGLSALIGGTSSQQAFLSSLGAHLSALAQGDPSAHAKLGGIGCAGEAQLLVAQQLLRSPALASHRHACLIEHAGEHMADAAAAMHAQSARRLQLLAAGVPRQSRLLSTLVSTLTVGSLSSADIHTLHGMLGATHEPNAPPPPAYFAEALRTPAVLVMLLRSLFDPSRPPKPQPRDMLLRILAHAAVGTDDHAGSGGANAAAAAASGGADGGSGSGAGSGAGGANGATGTAADSAAVLAALAEAQGICERNEVSDVQASVGKLQRCATHQVVACGILLWTRINLTVSQHSGARFNNIYLPAVLTLVLGTARLHPSLQGMACDVVHACLLHEPPSEGETTSLMLVGLRRSLIDGLLLLTLRGCMMPVMTALEGWLSEHADFSLVRHVTTQLHALCAPPYSAPFRAQLLRMLRHARTVEAHRGEEAQRQLQSFTRQVEQAGAAEDDAMDDA